MAKNGLTFRCLDSKFADMVVRDMTPEVFNIVKGDSEFLGSYSFIRKSPIHPKYLEKHFFKAEFIGWEANEFSPYCRLVQDLGPVYDEANIIKVITINNGISEEMYPQSAISQVETIT